MYAADGPVWAAVSRHSPAGVFPALSCKYNPIERCWGIVDNHWHGPLLDSIDTVLQCARTMTWNGKPPIVERVTTT